MLYFCGYFNFFAKVKVEPQDSWGAVYAGKEGRSECVPRCEAGSSSHWNHEVDSAVQSTGRSFCPSGHLQSGCLWTQRKKEMEESFRKKVAFEVTIKARQETGLQSKFSQWCLCAWLAAKLLSSGGDNTWEAFPSRISVGIVLFCCWQSQLWQLDFRERARLQKAKTSRNCLGNGEAEDKNKSHSQILFAYLYSPLIAVFFHSLTMRIRLLGSGGWTNCGSLQVL